jgi:hypothetical protein
MWKRCRYWFLLLALIGVALAVYFEPTRCVRGWLWGEAFFDGRPTSWWRERVDRWMGRFGSPEVALSTMEEVQLFAGEAGDGPMEVMEGGGLLWLRPKTNWERFQALIGILEDDEHWIQTPKVLDGLIDAEPTLHELVKEHRYRKVAERALANGRNHRANQGASQ